MILVDKIIHLVTAIQYSAKDFRTGDIVRITPRSAVRRFWRIRCSDWLS